MPKRKAAVFPWIELIPFALYAAAAIFAVTPNNVLFEYGLREMSSVTTLLTLLAAVVFAAVGFIYARSLS